jgi:invasion protein IalB
VGAPKRRELFGALAFLGFGNLHPIVKTILLLPCLAVLASTVALAQQAPPQPRRAVQNAQPARPAAPPPATQAAQPKPPEVPVETPNLIYSPWVKFCPKGLDRDAKTICYTAMDSTTEAGAPMASAVLIEAEGEQEKTLRISLPNALQLQPGMRVIIDQTAPMSVPFYTCLANGCIANLKATPLLIDKLRKGQTLVVQAYRLTGNVISVAMPLIDFAKASDGPPIDPKELETRQKEREELLQKRAEEARRKIEETKVPQELRR